MTERRPRRAIVLFAKAPRTGTVKTRLVPPLTPPQAAQLAGAFIADLAERLAVLARALDATAAVFYTPFDAANDIAALVGDLRQEPQRGCDLGERLTSMLRTLGGEGFEHVAVVGSDAPTLPEATIVRAFAALEDADIAIVGAEDGGYVLLALGGLHVALFEAIPWSTPSVYAVTLEQARRAGLRVVELPPWWDVDDGASLERLRRELAAAGDSTSAPRTRTMLEAFTHAAPTVVCAAPRADAQAIASGANVLLLSGDDAPLLTRPYLNGDEPSPLFASLAHVPEFLEPTAALIGAVYGPSSLPERLKEIVVLRVSARNGCRYCTRLHAAAAADAGLGAAEIAVLCDAGDAPSSFSLREAQALCFADAMCDDPDRAAERAAANFAEHELVELAVVAGTTIFLNRFAKAMGLS
ncbi:MAG: TIGR04282 family arsenosugar biosynthesis glycosyltransferase [Candidatus Eremiobacteraeota bacterium]|nr:TIGR04282 family arsenosugar biosynthesis glycosyltransferase [Candidatus Eremiobacteraeota bacterium]MBC5801853.1 TIGR04282 family arsenosugar biosynthesis glycosyltransferase [Candidatus Eremiobacteraeota bacterium]MBC5820995.1 TIGR04282 family arsenosugar biosynthesis glycosyltransferase [Candidatus Eremiobacteraeota bacterium]